MTPSDRFCNECHNWPIVRIPGPSVFRFLRGVREQGLLDCAGALWREYGDLFQVRVGWRTLIFAMHPDVVEHVQVTRKERYAKLDSYEPIRKYLIGNGVVASNGELWRRQRKLMAPFYTPKGIQAYADMMIGEGARFVARWDELARSGREVDIAQEMTLVTAAVILKAMFSSETIDSINQMKDAVETMLDYINARLVRPQLPSWVPTAMNRKYNATRRMVHHSITSLIEQRRALAESEWPDDLLSRMMKARDEETGEGMTALLLRDESLTTFFAGYETTARTMTFAWYALATNPRVRARLHDELDRVLGGRAPTIDALKQLPYTLQVIKEVLRLYPAAPFYPRDAVVADTLGRYDVPAGASVMMSPYYTHRHPEFWRDPEVFDPDRWTREREAARHRYAFHPFAAGQRTCIGNNFSLLESHILLAALAQRFAPALREGYAPRWEMRGTLTLPGGLPMIVRPRAVAAAA